MHLQTQTQLLHVDASRVHDSMRQPFVPLRLSNSFSYLFHQLRTGASFCTKLSSSHPLFSAETSSHDMPGRVAKDVLEEKLKNLRDFPVGVTGMRDDDIVPLYDSLMAEEKPRNGKLHWFCDEAKPIVRELAVLLTRLHAYDQERVERWRSRLIDVLHGCTKCIDALEEAKQSSETT